MRRGAAFGPNSRIVELLGSRRRLAGRNLVGLVLAGICLSEASASTAGAGHGSPVCTVADLTETPPNMCAMTGGEISGMVGNGPNPQAIAPVGYRGKPWAHPNRSAQTHAVGWVHHPFLACNENEG